MIRGEFSESRGARLRLDVYFPSLGGTINLPFVVDTGAVVTSVALSDLRLLGDRVQEVSFRPGQGPMAGVGGDVEWSLFDGALIFTHEDSSTTSIAQPIALLATSGIPSLLGRDILAKGVLTLDGPGRQVSLDLPRGFLR